MQELVAKRYVKALFSVMDGKSVKAAAETLQLLADAFSDDKVRRILTSPEVKKAAKEELMVSLLGKKADKRLVNFIKTLGLHNRYNLIPEIARQLGKELQHREGKYEGVVESRKALDKKLLGELEKSLSQYTKSKVVLKSVKSDIDGIRVSIDDLGLEASFSKERIASDMISHILKAL